MPTFRDTSKSLKEIYAYILDKLIPKIKNDPTRWGKCLKQLTEFTNLYERITQKEKELEGKTEHPTQRPFYYFKSIDKQGERIFSRLGIKARQYSRRCWGDVAI